MHATSPARAVLIGTALAVAAATAFPGPVPAAPRASIEAIIRSQWAGTGHEHTAVRVARCESGLNPRATHRNRNGTIDYGVFQINSGGTLQHLGLSPRSALNPHANIKAAYRLWKARGWRAWTCGRR